MKTSDSSCSSSAPSFCVFLCSNNMYTSEFNNVSALSNSRKRIKYGNTIRLKFMLQFIALIYNVSGAATLLSFTEIKEISCVQRRFYRVKCMKKRINFSFLRDIRMKYFLCYLISASNNHISAKSWKTE